MGSSSQNSSVGHWCRRRVRFNDILKKVPKVGRLWCRARSRSTGFRRKFRRRPGSGAEPGQAQQGSGKGSGEGREGFGAEPVRFNRVPEKVPEKVWEASAHGQDRRSSGPVKVWEALVQSQVRFNKVPEKVPEKVWEALRRFRRRSGRLWCKARSGSTGFG